MKSQMIVGTCLILGMTMLAQAQQAVATNHCISLLRDTRFQSGFEINAPKAGKHVTAGLFQPSGVTDKPVWRLCQWNSKFDLSLSKAAVIQDKTIQIANEAKSVTCSSDAMGSDLVLMLDSRPEYEGKVRTKGQAWPHLLVEQTIEPILFFKDLSRISFSIDARLLKNACVKLDGYRKELHTAQFPLTFILQNRRRDSKGFGDFIWFCVPLYDERKPFSDLYAAQDTADPSAKMIYSPPSRTFADRSLHEDGWVTFSHANLLPLFTEALQLARERGYLKASPETGDFAITSVNIGWEVTGINIASMQIRNLAIQAERTK